MMTNNDLIKQYNDEIKRIKRLLKYYGDKGYTFDNSKIIPNKPQKITQASVNRLQKITGKTVKSKATNISTPKIQTSLKPKKTSKVKAKEKRNNYYTQSNRKKGEKESPRETPETIANVVESFGGEIEDYLGENGYDNMFYDITDDEVTFFRIKDMLNEPNFEGYQNAALWSKDLTETKDRERRKAITIISDAISEYGLNHVAKVMAENATEIEDMINEILYRGSGNDYLAGRDAVTTDLIRLKSILIGHALDVEEGQQLADAMEQEELLEVLE